jgi:phenylalanyl-tRNA synthetase alpha chain
VPLDDFLSSLDSLTAEATTAFDAADSDALEAARVDFLGARSGRLKQAQKGLGKVDKADKPAAGKAFNAAKQAIEAAFETAKKQLASGATTATDGPQFDLTLPGERPRLGRIHPITRTISDLGEIMGRLGFSVAEGPEVEDEWHNFEALNIPSDHPARDPLENFYLATAGKAAPDAAKSGEGAASDNAKPLLLRSQTSTVQIRVMEKTEPPVRIISVGRVYRPDTADATHYPMFH